MAWILRQRVKVGELYDRLTVRYTQREEAMDHTESRILELEIIEYLRSLLVVLMYTLPDDVLGAAIEDIDIPVSRR